jgi:hypothetical protein
MHDPVSFWCELGEEIAGERYEHRYYEVTGRPEPNHSLSTAT